MDTGPFEIERKFLIRFPDLSWLDAEGERSEIVQTYLCAQPGHTERVRKRERAGRCVYTHTDKQKLTALRRIEIEREITPEEYEALLLRADPACRPVSKTRYCLPYMGQTLEIDLFPFWDDRAYLEIELCDERQELSIPPQITILREVSASSAVYECRAGP
ncbi:MAG: hypothetical protein IJ594_08130 [Oscillospiraceae bacterium]|nr:hypothetical protein [Oscillospiraceae bacterium]